MESFGERYGARDKTGWARAGALVLRERRWKMRSQDDLPENAAISFRDVVTNFQSIRNGLPTATASPGTLGGLPAVVALISIKSALPKVTARNFMFVPAAWAKDISSMSGGHRLIVGFMNKGDLSRIWLVTKFSAWTISLQNLWPDYGDWLSSLTVHSCTSAARSSYSSTDKVDPQGSKLQYRCRFSGRKLCKILMIYSCFFLSLFINKDTTFFFLMTVFSSPGRLSGTE